MKKLIKTLKLWFTFSNIKRRKYEALKKAKQLYMDRYSVGMCCSLEKALHDKGFNFKNPSEIIPEFNKVYLNVPKRDSDFWWNVKDVESRVKAFDTLIKLYE